MKVARDPQRFAAALLKPPVFASAEKSNMVVIRSDSLRPY